MSSYIIRSVNFLGDGVSFEYLCPEEDIRANGMLVNHGLLIPETEEFADALDLLLRTCQKFLADALRDFRESEPGSTSEAPAPDDDERSPYDNPDER